MRKNVTKITKIVHDRLETILINIVLWKIFNKPAGLATAFSKLFDEYFIKYRFTAMIIKDL